MTKFHARTVLNSLGPAGLEILRNGLDSVTDLMSLTLVRSARSSLVRNGWDFSTALLTTDGELVGQGISQPIHMAGMMPALQACLARYKNNIHPGDVLANNDPYEGGSHLPDIFLFKPVFAGDTPIAFLSAMVHHVDMGGNMPGSQAVNSTEIYQEGLRIPPLKLYDHGEPNETLFRLVEKAVRTPELVLADLRAQTVAIRAGEMELLRNVKKYGVEEFKEGLQELLDYTEHLTRQAIRALPDGTWRFTDSLDNDGITDDPIDVKCTFTKRDDEIFVDFDGSSPQCRGAIQGMFTTNKGMVYVAVKYLLGLDIPNTSGLLRPVTITAPEGTFVNPTLPAPVAARAVGCRLINHATWGAIAQAVPRQAFACPGGSFCYLVFSGYDKSTSPWRAWVLLDSGIGFEVSGGGRYGHDGNDAQCSNVSQFAPIPVEVIEMEFPIAIEEFALRPDSEGAGTFRGGLGLVREWRVNANDTTALVCTDRFKRPPWGLEAGSSAAPPRVVVTTDDNEEDKPGKYTFHADKGTVVRVEVSGAGGWGEPLERDPDKVLDDVIEEKVSPQRARQIYGVVVDTATRTVDAAATARLRIELWQQHG